MTNFNIDIERIIKDAFMENFNDGAFIDDLSDDICRDNPEWWAEKIVKPLKNTLDKAILENKDFIKEIIWEYMDTEFYEKIEDYIKNCIYEKVKDLTQNIKIKAEIVDE